MGRFEATAILVLAGVLPALGAELPARKAGLWELKMSVENRNGASPSIQQCIEASTDRQMQSVAGPLAEAACSKRDIQKSASGFTIDSTCTFSGKRRTVHSVITGSFESAYTTTVTSEGDGLPGVPMTIAATWLGPCTADQKPGDMILGNGLKMNILDMQKRGLSQGVPLPP
jgi:hypothetical protein